MEAATMGLYYMPFWLQAWWKDYKVQSLPRNTRLIFYDFLFLLWDRDMVLDNEDNAISYYLRITPEEWVDAKRTLLKAGLIQSISGNKRLDCRLLNTGYENVMENSNKQRTKAEQRWKKQRENS